MLISWKYKFLFLHLPKTGGTAMTRALAPYARWRDRAVYQGQNVPLLRSGLVALGQGGDHIEKLTGFGAHAKLREFEAKLGRASLENLTKIAIVRNPFTLATSLYGHIQRQPEHPAHGIVDAISFQDFVVMAIEKNWLNQWRNLCFIDEFEIATDFLCRFECLQKDADALRQRLGLPRPLQLETINHNPAPVENLAQEFGDTREFFVEANKKNFELFGYSTDIAKAYEPPAPIGGSR